MLDMKALQTRLAQLGLYSGMVDGIYGKLTDAALNGWFQANFMSGYEDWAASRKVVAGLQLMCKEKGIEVGPIDGLVGAQTRYAFEVYRARMEGDTSQENWRNNERDSSIITPNSKQWPREQDVAKHFGYVGSGQTLVTVPYELKLGWDHSTKVKRVSCHKLVAESFEKVMVEVLDVYGLDAIKRLRLDVFDGCLNVRRKRGGSQWSMHAWGIAFDFDAIHNQLKWNHRKASFAKDDYIPWFEAWERQGAVSLGRAKDYDWMHTQFARL